PVWRISRNPPLEQLILFGAKRTGQSVGEARDVLAADQMSEFGKFAHPRQFMECPPQRNQQVDIRVSRQGRRLRTSTGHPAGDVGGRGELFERIYVRVCGAEISEEAANGSAVVANGFGIERGAERGDGTLESIRQRMLKRRPWCAIHDRFPGTGRTCWA